MNKLMSYLKNIVCFGVQIIFGLILISQPELFSKWLSGIITGEPYSIAAPVSALLMLAVAVYDLIRTVKLRKAGKAVWKLRAVCTGIVAVIAVITVFARDDRLWILWGAAVTVPAVCDFAEWIKRDDKEDFFYTL